MMLKEKSSTRGLAPHLQPGYICLKEEGERGTPSLQGKPLRRVPFCPETVKPVYSHLVTVVPPGIPHASGCGHTLNHSDK